MIVFLSLNEQCSELV